MEAPRAARHSRLAPVSSRPIPINRTLGFPQSGWKRAHISDRVPYRVHGDGLLDQPTCRRQLAGWLAAFAAATGPLSGANYNIEELQLEIATLTELEGLAKRVRDSGADRKWEESLRTH